MSNLQETIKQGACGAAVRKLQTDLNALGAAIIVDGIFGEVTDETVRDFQAWQHLVEDGIVGPKTWKAIHMALARRQYMDNLARADRLRMLGEKAVERALELWTTDVYDPKTDDKKLDATRCKAMILKFIHEGLRWTWEDDYTGDGDFEWCLAFALFCWPELKESVRVVYGASTYRMDRCGAYRSAFGEPNPAPSDEKRRRLYMKCDGSTTVDDLAWEPRAGDIALVGRAGYGTHGVLVERFDKENGCLITIEGNADGEGPNGEQQEGVIRCERFFGGHAPGAVHVRRVIRWGLDDLR